MNEEQQIEEIIFEITKRMDEVDDKLMKFIDLNSKSKLIKKLIINLTLELEILNQRIDIIDELHK